MTLLHLIIIFLIGFVGVVAIGFIVVFANSLPVLLTCTLLCVGILCLITSGYLLRGYEDAQD